MQKVLLLALLLNIKPYAQAMHNKNNPNAQGMDKNYGHHRKVHNVYSRDPYNYHNGYVAILKEKEAAKKADAINANSLDRSSCNSPKPEPKRIIPGSPQYNRAKLNAMQTPDC